MNLNWMRHPMIELSNIEVYGFDAAYRGMRNSWKSHEKSSQNADDLLAQKLIAAGPEHRKFLRMIQCWMDVKAPLYWWKQVDAYKVGIVQNSESTMHTLMRDGVSLDDFSWEDGPAKQMLEELISWLNIQRYRADFTDAEKEQLERNMIELLPSCFMQKRTLCLSYETLRNMYQQRKDHKLSEWHEFCEMIEKLPESWMITGGEPDRT